ncbi:Uncharacterised protein [Salmonella enterica subsp. enterica]|uniref:Uncharacterized protein n=1 Tax=Salmonella enterica I TaxID=59201 RepID=A0A3S4LVD6_SALET|nr:Uncharacterised protein [Salmonella enterica subsp. enterica]
MLYGITKMRVGSMLNVYVICNNALVHKQYVIANSTERVQWFLLTNRLKDRLNTGYLITGLYYDTCRLADSWVYNCYYYFWYCMLYRIA